MISKTPAITSKASVSPSGDIIVAVVFMYRALTYGLNNFRGYPIELEDFEHHISAD